MRQKRKNTCILPYPITDVQLPDNLARFDKRAELIISDIMTYIVKAQVACLRKDSTLKKSVRWQDITSWTLYGKFTLICFRINCMNTNYKQLGLGKVSTTRNIKGPIFKNNLFLIELVWMQPFSFVIPPWPDWRFPLNQFSPEAIQGKAVSQLELSNFSYQSLS